MIEITVGDPEDGYTILIDEELAMAAGVVMTALARMQERNSKRKGVWKRSGLKGQVFHLFAKAERVFTRVQRNEMPDDDDLIDAINYAIFAEVLRRRGDINGRWPWPTGS